ncbi:hypothetical protein [Saccharopolyspora shandongensis]|uniref:hypothetical protein n=1 Tax=Saccharopolyspora shandongensis TaxID=418495 RepID=UPI00340D677A
MDFSSCGALTVPEDDPISLLVHESTWMGEIPGRERLCWLPHYPDETRLAVGLPVRLYDWFDAAYEPTPGKYYRDVFPY